MTWAWNRASPDRRRRFRPKAMRKAAEEEAAEASVTISPNSASGVCPENSSPASTEATASGWKHFRRRLHLPAFRYPFHRCSLPPPPLIPPEGAGILDRLKGGDCAQAPPLRCRSLRMIIMLDRIRSDELRQCFAGYLWTWYGPGPWSASRQQPRRPHHPASKSLWQSPRVSTLSQASFPSLSCRFQSQRIRGQSSRCRPRQSWGGRPPSPWPGSLRGHRLQLGQSHPTHLPDYPAAMEKLSKSFSLPHSFPQNPAKWLWPNKTYWIHQMLNLKVPASNSLCTREGPSRETGTEIGGSTGRLEIRERRENLPDRSCRIVGTLHQPSLKLKQRLKLQGSHNTIREKPKII